VTREQWYTVGFCVGWTGLYVVGLLAWEFVAWATWGGHARITDTIRTMRVEFGWVVAGLASIAMLVLGGLVVHFASGKPELPPDSKSDGG
jgi:membrane protease YdiL (CAAX protease family)